MSSFNFLPHREWALARRRRQMRDRAGLAASLAMLVLLGAHGWITQQRDEQLRVQASWQMGLHQLAQRTEGLAAAQPSLKEVKAHYAAIAHLQTDRNASVHLFNQLLPLMPPGLGLTQLSLTGSQTEIQGQAQEQIQVAQLFHALHESAAFSEVEWLDLSRQPPLTPTSTATASPQLGFSLRARLQLDSPTETRP